MVRSLYLVFISGLFSAYTFLSPPANARLFADEELNWQQMMDSINTYQQAQDYQSALKWALQAEVIAKEEFGELDTNYAGILYNLGQNYYYIGNADSSIKYFELSLVKYKDFFKGDHPTVASNLSWIAFLYDDQGRLSEAETLYKETLEMRRRLFIVDHPDLAKTLNDLGCLYEAQGRLNDAVPLFKEAMEMTRRLYKGDHTDVANCINNLAVIYQIQGRFNEAELLNKEALEMYKRLFKGDHPDVAKSIGNLAYIFKAQGRLSEAEQLFKEALEMINRLFKGDHLYRRAGLSNLALLYQIQGRLVEAEPLFKEALEMSRRLFQGDHPDLAMSLNNLASLYQNQGRLGEAELLNKEALEMSRRLFQGDHPDLALSLNNLANLNKSQGRLGDAEALFKEALEMNRRLLHGDHPNVAVSLNNLGSLYQAQGRLNEAEPLKKEALEMIKRIFKGDHPYLAIYLNNLANLYKSQGRLDDAEPLYKEALEIYRRLFKNNHPDITNVLNGLAYIYQDWGRHGDAELLYKEALELRRRLFKGEHPDVAMSLFNLAGLLNTLGKMNEAETFWKEALDMYKNIYINQSINLSEKEKEQYWNTMNRIFEIFLSFSEKMYSHNPQIKQTSYENMLFTKGLLLSSANKIKQSILSNGDSSIINLYNRWTDMKSFISRNSKLTIQELKKKQINLDSLEIIANDLEKNLSLKSSVFSSGINKKYYKRQDVQSKIKNDEAAIEIVRYQYIIGKRWTDTVHYAALILKSDTESPELVLLENGNDLENIHIKNYKNLIKNKLQDNESYNQFWAKIAPKLKGIKKVYFSPDGVYNQINLATLYNPKTKKYLLDELEIQVVTSTRDIVENKERKAPEYNNTAVLIGNPRFNMDKDEYIKIASSIDNKFKPDYYLSEEAEISMRAGIHPLPGTGIEIDKIGRLLGSNKWNVEKYSDNLAIEEVVKKTENPRILHIATHGKFLSDIERNYSDFNSEIDRQRYVENPLLRSYLIFAGADNPNSTSTLPTGEGESTEDGFLTAYEAQNLFLDKTELVVLSACETGLGEIRNGEGVYGLQRAFIQAGARSLIMSLWSVSDEATQELMVSFYQKWLSGKTKRQAFREAQQELKTKYPQPYYWGAFVMVGE